ncbi:MAG: M56 family metallopeptidase [Planctomycetaceae bacterium]|jgi:Zn-dependent protease with chaperone function
MTIGLPPALLPVLSWVGTYLVHSTLLIGGLWLVWQVRSPRSAVVRAGGWQLVLLAGLVTSLVQTSLWPQAGWRFAVTTLDQTVAEHEPAATGWNSPVAIADQSGQSLVAERAAAAPPATPLHLGWAWGLVALTVGSLAWGLAGWARHWLAFRALQAGCVPVTEGRAWTLLEQLRQQVPGCPEVDLVTADEACEPAAWALPQPTILLPERAERELDDGALAALLAHELAHLARHDAGWLQVARLACACLSLQPLNHLARREWQRAAECLGDDWAVRQTGDPLALARCLTTVAGWRTQPAAPLAALAALGTRSDLTVRVERLLERSVTTRNTIVSPWRRSAGLVPLALGLLAVLFVPGLSLTSDRAESTELATVSPSATTSSVAAAQPDTASGHPDAVQFLTTSERFGPTQSPGLATAAATDDMAAPPVVTPVTWAVFERVLVGAVGRVWERTVVLRSATGEVRWIQTTTSAVWSVPSPSAAADFPQIERWAL